MNNAKWGRLYRFHVDAYDLDESFFVRFFRKFGINCIPFGLRFCNALYIREDHSKYGRLLVEYCRKHGVTTYVVQEGAAEYIKRSTGHSPLFADFFLCPTGNRVFWESAGIPGNRIKEYEIEKDTLDYKGILFMHPFYLAKDRLHDNWKDTTNIHTMRILYEYLRKDVVFKLHQKNIEVMLQFIPKHRIVIGSAEELIKKYDDIYCFSNSTIRSDCEMKGKEYVLVDP